MLYYTTVDPETLGLLKKLMRSEPLSDFCLVGGTALALQIGHRRSIDLDLFSSKEFDTDAILSELRNFGEIKVLGEKQNTLNLTIDGIKVDMITYAYPLIRERLLIDDIRIFSKEDIASMKLSSIASRGLKRDFYDIYFLLKEYSLTKLLEFFDMKFANTEKFHIVKSLTYFDDAELEPDPEMVNDVDWQTVKSAIGKSVKEYLST